MKYTKNVRYEASIQINILLQSLDILLEDTFETLLEVVFLILNQVIKKFYEVICQYEMSRRILQEHQILLCRLIAFLTVVVKLQHRAHVTCTALLVLSVCQSARTVLSVAFVFLVSVLFEFLEHHVNRFLFIFEFYVSLIIFILFILSAFFETFLIVEASD